MRALRRPGSARALARAFVLLALGAFAAPLAAAQTTVLVSNIGETAGASSASLGSPNAQAFTTGGNAAGYTLTSVKIRIGFLSGSTPTFPVTINNAGSNDNPGTVLATLTAPGTLRSGTTVDNEFTHAGVALAANTTYFVVVGPRTAGNGVLYYTTSDSQSGEAGWSIADASRQRVGSESWTALPTFSIRMSLNGPAPDKMPTFGLKSISDRVLALNVAIPTLTLPGATGGDGTLTYSLTPALPTGLSFDADKRQITDATNPDSATLTFTLQVIRQCPI